MTIDPVCKMTVEPQKAAAKTEHQGVTYYFCCEHCCKKFTAHPEKYLGKSQGDGHSGHSHGHH